MTDKTRAWKRNEFTLRFAQEKDADRYFSENYNPLDPEAARLTGSKASFSKAEVVSFFLRTVNDPESLFLLLEDPDGHIAGESVVNEIDRNGMKGNFRIALFSPKSRGKGLGTWMTAITRDLAFEDLGLHRLELDVFSFNPGAIRTYEKAGFQQEGVLKDALRDGSSLADDILMAILREDWEKMKKSE